MISDFGTPSRPSNRLCLMNMQSILQPWAERPVNLARNTTSLIMYLIKKILGRNERIARDVTSTELQTMMSRLHILSFYCFRFATKAVSFKLVVQVHFINLTPMQFFHKSLHTPGVFHLQLQGNLCQEALQQVLEHIHRRC